MICDRTETGPPAAVAIIHAQDGIRSHPDGNDALRHRAHRIGRRALRLRRVHHRPRSGLAGGSSRPGGLCRFDRSRLHRHGPVASPAKRSADRRDRRLDPDRVVGSAAAHPDSLRGAFLSGAWTSAGKALVFAGGALAVSGWRPGWSIPIGRCTLGLFLLIGGVQHFLFAKFVASLIPAWFPGNATFWTYFAAVALICGGIGLLIPHTARLAALWSGIMVFSWFWIVHIPRVTVGMSDQIAVFEALAVSGIAFLLSGQLAESAQSKIEVS